MKRQLKLDGLHGVISQKRIPFKREKVYSMAISGHLHASKLTKTTKNLGRPSGTSGMRVRRDTIVSTHSVSLEQVYYTPKSIS
jgi:hypothetical protein